MGDEVPSNLPNLMVADLLFEAKIAHSAELKAQKTQQLLTFVTENKMAPFYAAICSELALPVDSTLLSDMHASNTRDLMDLNSRIEDAEQNLGESEVREAMLAKAEHYLRIGERDSAVAAYRATLEKTVAIGQKLDIVFAQIRMGFFFNDDDLASRSISKAKAMIELGGDWERRNRLKVYEALLAMTRRQLTTASQLFVDSLATFTASELFSYEKLVQYAVLTALVAFDRVKLHKQLVESPEVLAVIHKIPFLNDLLSSYYECDYAKFMSSLMGTLDLCASNRYLARHSRWYAREMRVRVYSQYLESYRSVQLASMATQFGLSTDLLDSELARFISQGRLNCKIDKVSGIIETNRPDSRNALYQTMIKNGDLLLNRLQKLSRVINL